jgi:hypothetical protein
MIGWTALPETVRMGYAEDYTVAKELANFLSWWKDPGK